MSRITYKGVEEARNKLPELVEQARSGQATVITRRGKPMGVLVPLDSYDNLGGQESLLGLEGSGRGLWGRHSGHTLRRLRSEWSR